MQAVNQRKSRPVTGLVVLGNILLAQINFVSITDDLINWASWITTVVNVYREYLYPVIEFLFGPLLGILNLEFTPLAADIITALSLLIISFNIDSWLRDRSLWLWNIFLMAVWVVSLGRLGTLGDFFERKEWFRGSFGVLQRVVFFSLVYLLTFGMAWIAVNALLDDTGLSFVIALFYCALIIAIRFRWSFNNHFIERLVYGVAQMPFFVPLLLAVSTVKSHRTITVILGTFVILLAVNYVHQTYFV